MLASHHKARRTDPPKRCAFRLGGPFCTLARSRRSFVHACLHDGDRELAQTPSGVFVIVVCSAWEGCTYPAGRHQHMSSFFTVLFLLFINYLPSGLAR